MRKSRRNFVLAALLFTFFCFPTDIILVASNATEVQLTVKQSFEQKRNEKEADFTGNYELRALGVDLPMPKNSQNNRYSFVLKGDKADNVISLQFEHGGVYQYQLIQTTKDKENYSYDRSVYMITVYMKNGENGELIPQVIVEKDDGKKYEELEFKNSYSKKNENSSNPSKPIGTVQTGDTIKIMTYVILTSGALSLIIFVSCFKRYNKKRQ